MNLTNGIEVPATPSTHLNERIEKEYNGKDYIAVIKSAKEPYFKMPNDYNFHGVFQVLEKMPEGEPREVYNEFYTVVLTKAHAKHALSMFVDNTELYINDGKEINN